MYNNIGEKIKTLAVSCFFVEAISAVSGAIYLLIEDESILLALLLLLLGPIVAWVSSWLLYGFGELIDTNQQLLSSLKGELIPTTKNLSNKLSNQIFKQQTPLKKSAPVSKPKAEASEAEPSEAEASEAEPKAEVELGDDFSPKNLRELTDAKNSGAISQELFEQKLNRMYWSGKITESQYLAAQKQLS